MTSEPGLVVADQQHADILTDAFSDDPFMGWVFGDKRSQALPTWWSFIGSTAPEGAELWRIDDDAASMWHPPRHAAEDGDEPEPSADEEHDEGRGEEDSDDEEPNPFVEMMLPWVGGRLQEIIDMLTSGFALRPEEPHWYLLALGTRAASQGHGLGAGLVRPVLDRCDEQGLGSYLESSNPRNIPFYHRLGFEIVNEHWTPDRTAVMTGMWRRPR